MSLLLDEVTVVAPNPAGGQPITFSVGEPSFGPDGSAFGYTLTEVDFDPAPLVVYRQTLPMTTGEITAGGPRAAREVTLIGQIVGRSTREVNALRRQVAEAFSDHGDVPVSLLFTPEDTVLELRGFTDGQPTFDWQGGLILGFTVKLVCGDPLAYGPVRNPVPVGVGTVLTNHGNADVYPTFTVTVAGGTCTGFRITLGGATFEVAGANLPAGTVISVETAPGRRRVVTGAGVSLMTKRTTASRWPKLAAGAHTASFSATGGTVTATARWRDGWVS